ncbi:hypothetical protein [Nocardioides sp.]|uniref:hypothetical protein n=1 Tax=Nocardioides sp. TaxID=35761 RepID=UPI002B66E177|nr:hypothetical protein [Nocardioides sp.]HXH79309.1 hypothetical protein [Nocardioides sp.]
MLIVQTVQLGPERGRVGTGQLLQLELRLQDQSGDGTLGPGLAGETFEEAHVVRPQRVVDALRVQRGHRAEPARIVSRGVLGPVQAGAEPRVSWLGHGRGSVVRDRRRRGRDEQTQSDSDGKDGRERAAPVAHPDWRASRNVQWLRPSTRS